MAIKTRESAIKTWKNDKLKYGYDAALGKFSEVCNTHNLIKTLPKFFEKYKIKSLNDCPCGHFNWMRYVMCQCPQIEYRGYDIVENMINGNKMYYDVRYYWYLQDMIFEVLPQADVILSRDGLECLPTKLAIQTLYNFKQSKCKYLLMSSNFKIMENEELSPGQMENDYGYRQLNLSIDPFNLGEPIDIIQEYKIGRSLAMWELV